MVDVFLIAVTAIAFGILFVGGFYLVVIYQHPDDRNDAYFPKIVVILGFVLAGATVWLFPLDVANNEGYAGCDGYDTRLCGGINMEFFWEIFFWLLPIWIFVLIPFSTFYYEADDALLLAGPGGVNPNAKSPRSKFFQAICGMTVLLCIVAIVFGISYLFLSNTKIPVHEYVGWPVSEATGGTGAFGVVYETRNHTNGTHVLPFSVDLLEDVVADGNDAFLLQFVNDTGTQYIELQVDVATFYAGLMAWIGWFLFAMFGGIGLAAMPLDLVLAFVRRPRHMSPADFAEAQLSIQQRVNDLVDIGEDIKREREERIKTTSGGRGGGGGGWFFGSNETRAERKTLKEFKAAVYLLEQDVEEFTACHANYENYNPLYPYISLLFGIISSILTVFWIIHIAVYVLPERPIAPFLNNYFEWFDGWFPLFGTLSVAIFAIYLLFCAVKGCFKFGLRFLFFQIHPMKPNGTYMSSFMFNTGLVLLCSLPVVQFCTNAFADYARFTTIRQIFGIQIEYLEFFTYFWTNNIFVYALLILSLLTSLYLFCRPRDGSKDSTGLRDKLKSRRRS